MLFSRLYFASATYTRCAKLFLNPVAPAVFITHEINAALHGCNSCCGSAWSSSTIFFAAASLFTDRQYFSRIAVASASYSFRSFADQRSSSCTASSITRFLINGQFIRQPPTALLGSLTRE